MNALPIEYYNAKALHQIGKSIGNVLREETHIATETKGKFARLCVQIDVNKPLITAILIGKFEQPVCYEGIQKLCFECGRVGHYKDCYPHIIRQDSPVERTEKTPEGSVPSSPCEMHDPDKVKKRQGSKESVNVSANEESSASTYGPWIVVNRKRNGTRNQVNGGTSMGQMHGQPRCGSETYGSVMTNCMGRVQPSRSNRPGKEVKRKLSPTREANEPLLASSLQRLVKTPSTRTEKEMEGQPKSMGVDKDVGRTGLGKEKIGFKPNQGDLVKGKKALARARALQANSPGAARAERGKYVSLIQHTQSRFA